MPAARKLPRVDYNKEQTFIYETGFPLGIVEGESAYIHNHVAMKIMYHTSPDFVGRRIVAFEVEPQRYVSYYFVNLNGIGSNCLSCYHFV